MTAAYLKSPAQEVRWHVTACTRKAAYPSRKAALECALAGRPNADLNPYRCLDCGMWHMTGWKTKHSGKKAKT